VSNLKIRALAVICGLNPPPGSRRNPLRMNSRMDTRLLLEGVHDLRNQHAKRPLNIASARRLGLRLREKLYADTQPAHLISWVDTWGTHELHRNQVWIVPKQYDKSHERTAHSHTGEGHNHDIPGPTPTEKAQSPNKHTHKPNQHHSRELT
jgi:hypothetical protein